MLKIVILLALLFDALAFRLDCELWNDCVEAEPREMPPKLVKGIPEKFVPTIEPIVITNAPTEAPITTTVDPIYLQSTTTGGDPRLDSGPMEEESEDEEHADSEQASEEEPEDPVYEEESEESTTTEDPTKTTTPSWMRDPHCVLFAICKTNEDETTTAEPPKTTTPYVRDPRCDDQWRYFNGSCFKGFDNADNFTFSDDECKKYGARLTSIHSQEESDFVKSITTAEEDHLWVDWNHMTFIGLIYNNKTANWDWVDGTPTDYLRWGQVEPNNMDWEFCGSIAQDCVTPPYDCSYEGMWVNFACEKPLQYYVCRKPALPLLL